jgi:AraC family transcriptional activator of pobA
LHILIKSITTYDIKNELSFEFEIIDIAETFKHYKDLLIAPHRAEFYHVFWFKSGEPTHMLDFFPVKIKPNSFLFINKNTVRVFDSKRKYTGKAILFTDFFFYKDETDIKFLRKFVLLNDLFTQIKWTKEMEDLFCMSEEEFQKSKDQFQADIIRNHLQTLLLIAMREGSKKISTEVKKGVDLDYTLNFKELLESQFKETKQVSSYAKQLKVNKTRLKQATSKIVGKSPKELIDERTILEVKRLLAHSSESIKEIGYKVGCGESTNFIKYFRKHTGQTPLEFRAAFLMD